MISNNFKKLEFNYRLLNDLNERKRTSSLIIENNENKFPLILEKYPDSKLNKLQEFGFYIPKDQTLLEFKNENLNEMFTETELNELIFLTEKNVEVNLNDKFEIIYYNF